MKKVTFFNHFHNGDIHISRGIVKRIMEKVSQIDPDTEFSYAHSNDLNLISDVPNLRSERLNGGMIDQFANLVNINGSTYISTWYAQQRHKYMNVYGMTIDCLYAAFDDTCKNHWGFSLSDISTNPYDFYPTIDYSKFEITNAQTWLHNYPQKKIFVSNGNSLSGQAVNFPMAPIIEGVARRNPEKIFILSNRDSNINLPNVFYSADIIKKSAGSDLNENSFLTLHCDVIIGRASGAFSFAWTQQNMFDRKAKFVCFCSPGVVIYPPHPFWSHSLLGDKIQYSAEYVVSDATDAPTVSSIIEQNI